MTSPSVAVTIVMFNSARYIAKCLEYVFEQDYPDIQIVVIDNASTDDTVAAIEPFRSHIEFVRNANNVGFAEGQNQAIALTNSDWVLTLNPDVRLTPNFISKAVTAAESDERVGSVSGKLLRMTAEFDTPADKTIDSTGIYFTPELRHFDRGSGESDHRRYERFEYVFGVTGAAAFYRRAMIQDVSIDGEFFDNDFFAYREDADLAWRAQLLGWRCLYTPTAVAYHVRNVLPTNRRSVSSSVNMHSVKNRFLMRIKNITGDLYRGHFFAITWRDLLILGACLIREWSSLRAFAVVFSIYRKMLAKRKQIMSRRRVDSEYMSAWFSHAPVSFPAPNLVSQTTAPAVTPR
ncbi:MAG: glycosyltransferase family 2 protein [Acidobacteriaceae bacterium]|nr:glycosyltransferase family 2 protein [Acidobacteriaceae bacterium]